MNGKDSEEKILANEAFLFYGNKGNEILERKIWIHEKSKKEIWG